MQQSQHGQAMKDAERQEYERKQAEARKAEEELRRKEKETLENMRNKEQQIIMQQKAQMTSVKNVDLTYRSPSDQKPGDSTGFGFGNVHTGQVSSRKITYLTRASSAEPSDSERGGLNPEVSGRFSSISARASPVPTMTLQKFQDQPIDDLHAPKTVRWAEESAAIAKTDFASSTKALGSGLLRASKSTASTSSSMPQSSSTTKAEFQQSTSQMSSFIQQQSSSSISSQSKVEFSSAASSSASSSKSSSFQAQQVLPSSK